MKDQYNAEIRRRRRVKEALDERYNPCLWQMPLTETNVFSMLAYVFPFNGVIQKILQKYFRREDRRKLMVSSYYLHATQRINPAYYSDRERMIVMLNRYRVTGDLDSFIRWLPFHEDRGSAHLIHMMIGVFFLDHYILNLHRTEVLLIALDHLQRGRKRFVTAEAHLAFNSLIAFAHYMNHEFSVSRTFVANELKNDEEFQERFLELIDKEAA